ncbi:MAG: hypothetical protein H7308_13220 [Chthonomonadaceae bacterium]|nr:hypothetical protein [Chthonomonadaceae bacterium]
MSESFLFSGEISKVEDTVLRLLDSKLVSLRVCFPRINLVIQNQPLEQVALYPA